MAGGGGGMTVIFHIREKVSGISLSKVGWPCQIVIYGKSQSACCLPGTWLGWGTDQRLAGVGVGAVDGGGAPKGRAGVGCRARAVWSAGCCAG